MGHRDTLQLVREAPIADLLEAGNGSRGRLEASGVLARDGTFLVVFDNLPTLGLLDERLTVPGDHRRAELAGGRGTGYEDLATDAASGRLFVLIESLPEGPPYRAWVEEFDDLFRLVATKPLDFPLEQPNKGFEGLSCVRRDGRLHLLGLCEGNRCRAGAKGRKPGGGRIQVFTESPNHWRRVATIALPVSLPFRDYAGIALSGDRIAVVSQESAALWVGELDPADWSVVDDGAVHEFPRDDDGALRYGHVEGVSWLAPDQVVVVSDRAKRGERRGDRRHDESIAVFTIAGEVVERQPASTG